jgi:prepilin-type N-terminal cleavage/methylation domain-containing protein
MNGFTHSRQEGFTLIELLLVLGAIALLAVTAFYVYPSVKTGIAVNHDRQAVQLVAANVQALWPSSWDASKGPALSDSYYSNPYAYGVTDPFSEARLGARNLGVGEVDAGTTGIAFSINLFDLTENECVRFLSGGPDSIGAIGAYANDNPFGGPTGLHKLTHPTDVIEFCGAAATDGKLHSLSVLYGHWPWPYD